MDNLLLDNEVFDDLQCEGLKVIQNRKHYCFTSDSVLLANWLKLGHKDKVVEFCSGCGVISFLANAKNNPKSIVGFELDSYLCDMSKRSVIYNNIKNVSFENCDLSMAKDVVGREAIDVLICNPPYFILKKDEKINEKYTKAKYETATSLEQIFKSANAILKFSGKFYMEHTPSRVQEVLSTALKYNFVCKNLVFIYPKNKKDARLVMFKFVKHGNGGMIVEKPIYD